MSVKHNSWVKISVKSALQPLSILSCAVFVCQTLLIQKVNSSLWVCFTKFIPSCENFPKTECKSLDKPTQIQWFWSSTDILLEKEQYNIMYNNNNNNNINTKICTFHGFAVHLEDWYKITATGWKGGIYTCKDLWRREAFCHGFS